MFTAPWSYPEDLVSMVIDEAGNQGNSIPDNERIVDLTRGPPAYEGNKYISRLKQDLGIKVCPEKALLVIKFKSALAEKIKQLQEEMQSCQSLDILRNSASYKSHFITHLTSRAHLFKTNDVVS